MALFFIPGRAKDSAFSVWETRIKEALLCRKPASLQTVGQMGEPIRSPVFKNVKTFPLLGFDQKDNPTIPLLISCLPPFLE
jgi:hypothetical protein